MKFMIVKGGCDELVIPIEGGVTPYNRSDVLVPFNGEEYGYGDAPRNVYQKFFWFIQGSIFNQLIRIRNSNGNTILIPKDLIERVVKLSLEGEHSKIISLLNED